MKALYFASQFFKYLSWLLAALFIVLGLYHWNGDGTIFWTYRSLFIGSVVSILVHFLCKATYHRISSRG